MGIEASAKITLVGGSAALKELQGVTRGTRDASKAATAAAKENQRWAQQAIRLSQQRIKSSLAAHAAEQKANQRTSAVAIKEAQRAALARAKADQDAVKSAQKAAQEIERIAQKQADHWARLAQKSAEVSARAAAKKTADAQREAAKQIKLAERTAATELEIQRRKNKDMGGLIGVATAGALAGGMTAVSTARSTTGRKSISERVQAGNDFRMNLVAATEAAGIHGEDREKVQGQILGASKATGTDAGELLGAVQKGQAKFNDMKFFADNLTEIGTIAKSAEADTGDLVLALGYMRQGLELTDKETIEAAYLMKSSADKGSIEVKNFAKDMAAGIGIFASNTGQRGLGGVRQLLGVAQGIGTGGFDSGDSAAESGTRFERFSADLNDVGVKKGLAGIGVKGFVDRSGKIDVDRLITQLSNNKKFQSPSVRQGIFKETRTLQAVEALMTANQHVRAGRPGSVDLHSIATGVDATQGKAAVDSTMEVFSHEGAFKAQQKNAEMQADTTANLESFNGALGLVNEAADTLETSFGSLSLWASSIAAMGLTGLGGSLLKGALGGKEKVSALEKAGGYARKAGGWLAGAAGGIGSVFAAGGTAVGAAGAGMLAATVGTGLAIGGSVGLAANYGTGLVRDDGKALSDLIVDALLERGQKQALSAGGTRGEDGTLVAAIREQTRKLDSIDSGLRANGAKPAPGGPRGPR